MIHITSVFLHYDLFKVSAYTHMYLKKTLFIVGIHLNIGEEKEKLLYSVLLTAEMLDLIQTT